MLLLLSSFLPVCALAAEGPILLLQVTPLQMDPAHCTICQMLAAAFALKA